jgi:hypothetical protein
MGKNDKSRIAFEALMILLALGLFCVVTRIWPLVFLVIPVALIAALRLLFVSVKKADAPAPPITITAPPRSDSEEDIIRIAFGVLQRRVTEQVTTRYPAARWVWDVPNAMERFAQSEPLVILLNGAGGFRKAAVQVNNLQFRGLLYETVKSDIPEEPPLDEGGDPGIPDEASAQAPVDYSILAFGWVQTNLSRLNELSNIAIADGRDTLLIPADTLPREESWEVVCRELTRNGFADAGMQENGILVTVPK